MSDNSAEVGPVWTPPKKKFNRLDEFRSVIDDVDDLELLLVCQALLRDKMEIFDSEEKLAKLQEQLYADQKRNFFSFFVEGLDSAEIQALAGKCSGKVKILEKKAEAQNAIDAANKSDVPAEQK